MHGVDDGLHLDRSQQVEPFACDTQAFGAHLDLLDRLFARDVQHRPGIPGDVARDLQEQRGFADARLTADQDQRARDQSPAEHAVHLRVAHRDAFLRERLDLRQNDRRHGSLRQRRGPGQRRLSSLLRGTLRHLGHLLQRIPRAAVGAFPHPLALLAAALLADVFCT